ncbi:MAG: 4Fe-4S binding protein, partial [Bacteroidetes bacterium]|nr:4Fe-4S binding protein [Bacteroidota bacterium]
LFTLANKISDGRGVEEDLDLMEKLSESIIIGSLCGLGKSGPNPFVSTVRYFRDEYLAHIRDKKCPAGVCTALIRYDILEDKCDGCLACTFACAVNAISGRKGKLHVINQDLCTKCGACAAVCRRGAVTVS